MHKTTTYGERLRQARDHAGISQSELGRQIGMSPQSVQYLEDPEKAAQGSNRTAKIADVCGVRALWLESGEGSMIDRDSSPIPAAANVAKAIKALRPELQRAVGLVIGELGAAPEAGRRYSVASPSETTRVLVRERTKTGKATSSG